MKKRKTFEELERVAAKRFHDLEDFLDGPMVALHEYIPSDHEFKKRVTKLYRLVYELKTATDGLHFIMTKI